ncbi:zinc metalloprotease [Leptolinea sp. HRD-7]|nr:zinc metalloprotease [Leptolinea sp. HRD-7]
MLNLDPLTLISRAIILVIAFTIHEFSHAFIANAYGDDTPRVNGRLTLNPLVHLDVIGSLMLVIAGFGWAKPVPVNPYWLKQRSRSAIMWVSLAGPLSNLLMAFLAALPLKFGLATLTGLQASGLRPLAIFWVEFIWINIALMVFNLIPVAPLDGEKVLDFFLPPSAQAMYDRIRPYSPAILLILIFALPYLGIDIVSWIMSPAVNGLFKLFTGLG